ncbi:MAG TPA: SRPBCC family protein, partial [Myxococcota bacterium]
FAVASHAADDVKVWTEKVEGSDIPYSVAEGVVDAPAAVVWSIVSDCNNYKTTMAGIIKSQEISRAGEKVVCQVTADLPFPLPDLTSKTSAVHTVEVDKKYVRKWALLEGDYTINEGSWQVVAIDDTHSKATYRLRVQPNIPVPDSLLSTFQSSAMPRVIKNLREQSTKKLAAPKTP